MAETMRPSEAVWRASSQLSFAVRHGLRKKTRLSTDSTFLGVSWIRGLSDGIIKVFKKGLTMIIKTARKGEHFILIAFVPEER